MTENNSDFALDAMEDFDMDAVDSMPEFVNEIKGVYACDLSLERDAGEKNGKHYDNLVFKFIIEEEIEQGKDFGVSVDDLIYVRFPLTLSQRDIEQGNKHPFGLRLAKDHLASLAESLGTSNRLNDIVKESQGTKVIATFDTRYSKGKNSEGETIEYKNIQIRKLIVK